MKTLTTVETQQALMRLDTAELRDVYVHNPWKETYVKDSKHKAVWNIDAGHTSSLVSNQYALIQHRVLFDKVQDWLMELGIQPSVQEVVKSSTAQWTAEELITRRGDVKAMMLNALQARLSNRGIVVEEISITNFDFSDSFNAAIESKVTAEQLKLKADRDLERIIIEKEQKITQAQAEAESLRLQKQEVTEELIRLREIEVRRIAIDKWDGKLPTITSGVLPFIEVTP